MAGTFSFGGSSTGSTSSSGPWTSLALASTTGTTFPSGNKNLNGDEVIYVQSVNVSGHGTGGTGVYFGSTSNAATAVANAAPINGGTVPSTHAFMAVINGGSSAVSWNRGSNGGTTYDNHGDVFTAPMCGSVTWATVPAAPASLSFKLTSTTSTSISVTMGTTSDDGGLDLSEYVVQASVAGGTWTTIHSGPAANFTVASPAGAGQSLVLRSFAVNAAGNSAARVSGTVTMPTVPAIMPRPSISNLTGTTATANWVEAANGGSDITSFTLALNNGVTGATDQVHTGIVGLSYTQVGMAPGTKYSFDILAVNAWGSGPYSALTPFTTGAAPATPGAPTGSAVSASSIQWSWAVPAANGSAITSYTLQIFQGGTSVEVITGITGTTYTSGSLLLSTAYTAEILAVNALGASSYSAASAAVTTLAGAYAPTVTIADNSSAIFQLDVAAPTQFPGSKVLAAGIEVQVSQDYTFTTGVQTYTSTAEAPANLSMGTGSVDGLTWVSSDYYFLRAAVKYSDATWSAYSASVSLAYGGTADAQVGNGTSFQIAQAYLGDGTNWTPLNAFVGDGTLWQPLT